jgi:four helix bundle protein
MENSHRRAVRDYRDLVAWQKAVQLAVEIYSLSDTLIARRHFELSSQLRRAALSVSGNIAEGANRCHQKEFAQSTCMARASAREVESHLTIAVHVKALSATQTKAAESLCDEISRMLATLRRRLVGGKSRK